MYLPFLHRSVGQDLHIGEEQRRHQGEMKRPTITYAKPNCTCMEPTNYPSTYVSVAAVCHKTFNFFLVVIMRTNYIRSICFFESKRNKFLGHERSAASEEPGARWFLIWGQNRNLLCSYIPKKSCSFRDFRP